MKSKKYVDIKDVLNFSEGNLLKFHGNYRVFYRNIESGMGVNANFKDFLERGDYLTLLEAKLHRPKNWLYTFSKEKPSERRIQEIVEAERRFKDITVTEIKEIDPFNDSQVDETLWTANYIAPGTYSGYFRVLYKDIMGWIRITQATAEKINKQFIKAI